jgi:hypothetical protein
MNNRNIFITGLILSLLLSLDVSAQETKLSRKQMPAAVMLAFHSAYPKASVKGTNKEIKDGVSYYEIESKDGAIKRDILYKADGTVVEIEEIITKKTLPEAINVSLKKDYSTYSVKSIEKNIQGSVTHYEVMLASKKGKKMEIVFNENGVVVK